MYLELMRKAYNKYHDASFSGSRKSTGRRDLYLAMLNLFLYVSSIKRPVSLLEKLLWDLSEEVDLEAAESTLLCSLPHFPDQACRIKRHIPQTLGVQLNDSPNLLSLPGSCLL